MKRLSSLVLPLLIAASLSACKRDQDNPPEAPPQSTPATSAPAEVAPSAAQAPAVPAAAPVAAAAPAKPFDLESVAVTDKTLPAFPYLSTPAEAKSFTFIDQDLDFDRVQVLAGEALRTVEGKILLRRFPLDAAKWSSLAAHRNYESALKALGATRVDAVHPANEQFVARNGGDAHALLKKMKLPRLTATNDAELPGFEQWLIRTPTTNIWLSFCIDGDEINVLVTEEKALQQIVMAVPAASVSGVARAATLM